jgi:phosphoribosylaminoimidazole (AIR) synthetase
MWVNENECKKAGIDIKKVESIAKRIARAASEAKELGISIFGGSSGMLRFHEGPDKGDLILANISEGIWDGGCGAHGKSIDGYIRGEI